MRGKLGKRFLAFFLCVILCMGDNAVLSAFATPLDDAENKNPSIVVEETNEESFSDEENTSYEELASEEASYEESESGISIVDDVNEASLTGVNVADIDFGDGVDLSTLDIPEGGHINVDNDFDIGLMAKIPDDTMKPSFGELEDKYISPYRPEVKDQKSAGICWAESITGASEYNLIKDGIVDADSSEMHLSYFAYNHANDPLKNTELECQYGETVNYIFGGHEIYSGLGLATWKGLAAESALPVDRFNLDDDELLVEMDSRGLPIEFNGPNGYPSRYAGANDAAYLEALAYNDSYYLVESKLGNIVSEPDYVKTLIKEYGAVSCSYNQDSTGKRIYNYVNADNESNRTKSLLDADNIDYDNSVINCYYNANSSYSQNHAITIVGWDDNYPKENFVDHPDNDGAWLIRNSWGVDENKGEDYLFSYFWLSYEEPSLQNMAIAFDVSNTRPADNNYFYDGSTALVTTENGLYYSPMSIEKNVKVFATDFVAKGGTSDKPNEEIKAVVLNTSSSYLKYDLKIYVDTLVDDPTSGSLAYTQSGEIFEAGTRVINLNESVFVEHGKRFTVVLDFSATSPENYGGILVEYNKNSFGNNICEGHTYVKNDYNTPYNKASYDTSIKVWTDNTAMSKPSIDIPSEFVMDSDGVTLKEYKGSANDIVIPYGVEAIADNVFKNKTDIKSVTFPSSLRKIGKGAFYNTSITSLTIPYGVKEIGNASFGGCKGLKKLIVNSSDLSVVNYNNGRYEVSSSLVLSSAGPFVSDDNLNDIELNINRIPAYLFTGCTGIESYHIDRRIKTIGEYAFYNTKNLEEISFDEDSTLATIEKGAFFCDKKLKTIVIPDSVDYIGLCAFAGCEGLESITLSKSLTTLGSAAFSYCPSLKTIVIPKSLKNVDYNYNFIGADNSYGNFINAGPFGLGKPGNNMALLSTSTGQTQFEHIVFEDGCTEIPAYLFSGYDGYGDIYIPNTVTKIGKLAFYNCNNLSRLYIPSSVSLIEEENAKKYVTIKTSNADFSIYGASGSYAETYAKNAGLKFNGYRLTSKTNSLTMNYGETRQAADLFNLSGFDNASITLESSNPSILSVNDIGDACGITAVSGGKATVTAKVVNYGLSAKIDINVKKALTDSGVEVSFVNSADVAYTGKPVKPNVIVKDGDSTLTVNKDYTLAYENNTDITNAAKIKIKGKGFYSGTLEKNFNIKYDLQTAKIKFDFDGKSYVEYSGLSIVPDATKAVVTIAGKKLDNSMYKCEAIEDGYHNNILAGTGIVRILPKTIDSEVMGYIDASFEIRGINIASRDVAITVPKTVVWTGTNSENPGIVVKNVKTDTLLTVNSDYELIYSNNARPGTAKVMISGLGQYSGSKELTYTIAKPSFVDAKPYTGIEANDKNHIVYAYNADRHEYSGKAQKLRLNGESSDELILSYNGITLVPNKDYSVKYKSNTNLGKAILELNGKGIFTGKYNKTGADAIGFIIEPMSSLDGHVAVSISEMKYTGNECKPKFSASLVDDNGKLIRKLVAGKDYKNSFAYTNNIETSDNKILDSEQPKISVVYIGNLGDTDGERKQSYNFRIYASDCKAISDKSIKAVITPNIKYNGSAYGFSDLVTLKEGDITLNSGVDYIIVNGTEYKNAGKYSVTIKGINKYYGTRKVNFTIGKKNPVVSGDNRNIGIFRLERVWFTGYAYKPSDEFSIIDLDLDVALVEGEDYKYISYPSTKPGYVKVSFKFLGNYNSVGTYSIRIPYETYPLTNKTVSVTYDEVTYNNGKKVNPKNLRITKYGKPVNPKLFTIKYSDNTEVTDSAKITLIPKKNMFNSTEPVVFTYSIKKADISKSTVSKIAPQTYMGKAISPKPVVKYNGKKLTEGSDYYLEYADNNKKGIATVRIIGNNNFLGTKEMTYIIK